MKLDFTKNTSRNFVSDSSAALLGLLLPFLNRTFFLWIMGPQYLGLNGLFNSILGTLSLAELGFGSAVAYALYKPVAEDDRDTFCAYLSFYRTIYRVVGIGIFSVGLCLIPFLPRLVHGSLPPEIDLRLLYLLHLTNTAVSYFFFAYRGCILGAHNRNDILTNIRTATTIAQYLTSFLILFLTRNYYHYVIAAIFYSAVSNLLILYQSRKLFPELEPKGKLSSSKRHGIMQNVKNIFIHKIGGIVAYSEDNIIISAFLGLAAVATYGNYYYVFTAVSRLPAALYGSMRAGIGNRLNLASREENFQLFLKIYRLVEIISLWCAAVMLAVFQPFIKLWVGNRPELARHFLTEALFVLFFHVQQSRQVVMIFKDAAGLWHKDRWKPLVSASIKLILNFLFVFRLPDNYKLDGFILASILAFLVIELPWESYAIFTSLFNRRQEKIYWRAQARFAALALLFYPLTWTVAKAITLDGFWGLVAKGAAAASFATVFLGVCFRQDFAQIWESCRAILQKKKT